MISNPKPKKQLQRNMGIILKLENFLIPYFRKKPLLHLLQTKHSILLNPLDLGQPEDNLIKHQQIYLTGEDKFQIVEDKTSFRNFVLHDLKQKIEGEVRNTLTKEIH